MRLSQTTRIRFLVVLCSQIGRGPKSPSAGVGLSIRPAVLNCVLVAAWRQGLLSFPVPLPGSLAPIVEEVFIDAHLPPLFGPSSRVTGFPFELQFGALVIEVRRAGEVETDRYSLSLRAGLDIELDGGAFAIQLADLPEVRATLEKAGSTAPLPASLIEQTLGFISLGGYEECAFRGA